MGLFRGISLFVLIGVASCAFSRGEAVPLFQPGGANGTRGAGLLINQEAVSQLRSGNNNVSLGAVPLITGESASFRLSPMRIFSPNATIQVINDDGTTVSMAPPDVKTWYGVDPDHPDRALFVAASPAGEVRAMVTGNAQTSVTVISRDVTAGANAYRVERATLPARDYCDTTELPRELREAVTQTDAPAQGTRAPNNITYEIELMIDVGYVLYEKFDFDGSATMDYLTELFGSVNAIYRRDINVQFTLSYVTIWATPDPISATPKIGAVSTFSQIRNYRSFLYKNRSSVPYDVAHFIDGLSLGGRAYVDIMQIYRRDARSGVSNVYATGEFPTDGSYYWDTMVIAHELGHNLGSPHSHCYKPPIDCCEDECEDCTFIKPTMGTLMSYCHLQIPFGGGVDMRFHERCIALMRNRIETSLILSPYQPKAEVEVRGLEGALIPANATDTARSTLFKSNSVGSSVDHSFEIRNLGGENLHLTGSPNIVLLKPPTPTQKMTDPLEPLGNSSFSVTMQPAKDELKPGEVTIFNISYKPSNDETQWAVVEIRNDDSDEAQYRFLIKGRLTQPSNPFVGVFNGNITIPEQGDTWTVVPIVVEDVPGEITNVQVEFGGGDDCSDPAQTGIEHSWVGDLTIMLESPDGTTMTLVANAGVTTSTDPGVGGNNFCHTILSDDAPTSIQDITVEEAPYSGSYTPKDPLTTFLFGEPNGTWKFWFYDRAQPDQGVVHQVKLIIRGDAASAATAGPGVIETPAENWRLFH